MTKDEARECMLVALVAAGVNGLAVGGSGFPIGEQAALHARREPALIDAIASILRGLQ